MANIKNSYTTYSDYGLPFPNAGSAQDIQANIEALYAKMAQCTRQISYFDLYKITTIVNQASELSSQINALAPYTSLIINTPIETGDGVRYNIGDLVIKNNDGSHDIIEAQRGGIFYPQKITKVSTDDKNYSYDISFHYQSSAPSPGKAEISPTNNVWEVKNNQYFEKLTFQNIGSGDVGSPYNLIFENKTSFEFDASFVTDPSSKDKKVIDPIIHAYAIDPTTNVWEEVYADQDIKYTTTNDKTTISVSLYGSSLIQKVVVK